MAYDPKESRDTRGRWSSGSGGYGKGQTLKGRYKEPKIKQGSFSNPNAKPFKNQDPSSPVYTGKRFGRMSSTEKAGLQASAQFSTKTKPGKVGKLPTLGATSPRMMPAGFGEKFEPHGHAVVIQTAKALDRDFHRQREKVDQTAMKEAISKHQGAIVKYPSKKPRR